MPVEPTTDFETLSAYVDGELDAATAAALASRIAADSNLARQVAEIHGLKAAVSGLGHGETPRALPARPRRPRPALRHLAAAAAVVLTLGIAAVGGQFWRDAAPSQERVLLEAILAEHDGWRLSINEESALRPAVAPGQQLLADAGLVQIHGSFGLELAGVTASHRGYAGPRGCRLSVFELSAPLDPAALEAVAEGDGAPLVHAWQAGGAGFVAVARNMDPLRFDALSAALEAASARGDRVEIAAIEIPRTPCIA
ncbi:hypothetical protein EMQ25_06495 [Arsenicitalea aurantiaca]|uniref:Anti-sigma factor n=1 Tax=Arsenicitalea aurantiaca TaxID=1783274 RepID=A0A433XFR6_9HYPH|nr:hypothetical protein [Arsenicitalea aurantiaca]RUT32788.1 hypothetical protein EMQ25_06495 [Arsenicitalea aurantiaca]